MVGNNAQEKAAAFFNRFTQFFLPIFARLKLLFVEPDQATGLLKLADDETRDFQIRRPIADKDAAGSALLFTMCFLQEVRISGWRRMFLPPATVKFRHEFNRSGRDDADLFREPAKVDNDLFLARPSRAFLKRIVPC